MFCLSQISQFSVADLGRNAQTDFFALGPCNMRSMSHLSDCIAVYAVLERVWGE